MAVVPGGSVLESAKLVGECVVWSDWALGDAIDAVHLHCVLLSESVPVDRGTVVLELVRDGDSDSVSPACLDPGAGVGLVEDLAFMVEYAVSVNNLLVNHKIVLLTSRSDKKRWPW